MSELIFSPRLIRMKKEQQDWLLFNLALISKIGKLHNYLTAFTHI